MPSSKPAAPRVLDPFDKIPPFEKFKPRLPKGFEKLPPASQEAWIKGGYEFQFSLVQQELDHKELVRPAPEGFKPESAGRKLKLSLTLRDKTIPRGGYVWYKLELQNVGSEPVDFYELIRSFFKDPLDGAYGRWKIFRVGPDGKREEMSQFPMAARDLGHRPRRSFEPPAGLTRKDIFEAAERERLKRKAARELRVRLAPGETLSTRPWRWVDDEEYQERFDRGEAELWPRPEGECREFYSSTRFNAPGKYRLQIIYRDEPPKPPIEDQLKQMEAKGIKREHELKFYRRWTERALGILESNVVVFEVRP